MSNVLFANLAGTTLASAITTTATTITLTSGGGAAFPTPSSNQFFPLTLQAASNPATYEIVYVTATSTDTLTVVRGREGTTGTAFSAGDLAQNRPTGATLEMLGVSFAVDSGNSNALAIAIQPAYATLASLIGIPILVQKSGSANTGAMTLNVNGLGATSAVWSNNTNTAAGRWAANATALVVYNGSAFAILTEPVPGWSPSSLSATSFWKQYPDQNSPTGYVIEQGAQVMFNGSFITFPIAFPNAFVSMSTVVAGNPGYNGDTVQIDAFTNHTGFTGYGGQPGGPTSGPVFGGYIAKGY